MEKEIILNSHSSKEGVEISVKHLGLGIPQKEIPRIFERFYQVNRAYSNNLGGYGLGLSIVIHLEEAHCGTLSARSLPEQGSTFTISIPYLKGTPPQ